MRLDDPQVLAALRLLTEVGAVIHLPGEQHLSLGAAARKLDCGKTYLRTHLAEFPNAWRMPGGELRIPAKDVEALAKRGRLFSLEVKV